MAIEYYRDVPRDSSADELEAEEAGVVAHLSAITTEDDDPETNADDVRVYTIIHPEHDDMLRIVGTIDAEVTAPYLRDDFDPYSGVDHGLFAAEIAAAERDLEVLRGQE